MKYANKKFFIGVIILMKMVFDCRLLFFLIGAVIIAVEYKMKIYHLTYILVGILLITIIESFFSSKTIAERFLRHAQLLWRIAGWNTTKQKGSVQNRRNVVLKCHLSKWRFTTSVLLYIDDEKWPFAHLLKKGVQTLFLPLGKHTLKISDGNICHQCNIEITDKYKTSVHVFLSSNLFFPSKGRIILRKSQS